MLEHEAERFRESENRVGRFAARIREVLNRKEGTVNVVVSVDQKQLHADNVARGAAVSKDFSSCS
jgi:aromatic ring-opening dioxygenase LigB subunit